MADEEIKEEQNVGQEPEQYYLDSGEPCSRAEYIRQEFQKDRSRREIADELGVRYNIVYSATANMENAHHQAGKGNAGKAATAEDPRSGEVRKRADIMRELYEQEGWPRRDIADHFEVPYGTVYGATKDATPPEGSPAAKSGKVVIEHPETGEQIPRIDFIREKWEEGWERRDIANAAGCDYSVVWMATRPEKDEEQDEEQDKEYLEE